LTSPVKVWPAATAKFTSPKPHITATAKARVIFFDTDFTNVLLGDMGLLNNGLRPLVLVTTFSWEQHSPSSAGGQPSVWVSQNTNGSTQNHGTEHRRSGANS